MKKLNSILLLFNSFWFLDISKKNDIFNCYDNILKKFLSIEVMIPLLERISLFTDMKKNDKYVFKIDTFLHKNMNKNSKK